MTGVAVPLRIDVALKAPEGQSPAALAARFDELGYDGLWSSETNHDPFLPLAVATGTTTRAQLGTAVAVAFARSPMTLAHTAHDLQVMSGGRFVLGLGSQVKAHVERRFAMPWSSPAARMADFVRALRAIWTAWDDDSDLDFRGEFYTHTLTAPVFRPPASAWGQPLVHVAAVGELMTRVAAQVADGLIAHTFTTRRYLVERTGATVDQELAAGGRDRHPFEIGVPVMVVTGETSEQRDSARSEMRRLVAFYASTPAYRSVLELHGWADVGERLTHLSKSDGADRWEAMTRLVDDDVLDAFVVDAEPGDLARALYDRYAGVVQRVTFNAPRGIPQPLLDGVAADLRRLTEPVVAP